MSTYYTAITALVIMALAVLCVLVRDNERIASEDKRLLYVTYVLIGFAAIAEWLGVQLNGRAEVPSQLLRFVKFLDYSLTPLAAVAFVSQMRVDNRWHSVLKGLAAVNVLFQFVSMFTGWMIVIDNQGYYSHGVLYPAYVVVSLAVVALVVVEFFLYSRGFGRRNRASVYAIVFMVFVGFAMQQVMPDQPRTSYIALALGAAMMFIHYEELASGAMAERIVEQQDAIDTDALTGARSRYAYNRAIEVYEEDDGQLDDFVAFVIDINGLKQVNDTLGHAAGDELIMGAVKCIENVLDGSGECYRTGGDEFVVLAHMKPGEAGDVAARMEDEARKWQGELSGDLTLSVGFAEAAEYAGIPVQTLMRKADAMMYAEKAKYYRRIGTNRRKKSA